ncbi:MAG: hypothetical protein DRH37_02905 [Deltaproteobacteria bacterium]|nr:MAG: hypothetical protein DRH37_02905 [Deltaproteobacteria bacterium]
MCDNNNSTELQSLTTIVENAITVQRELQKNKDWALSEVAKLKKSMSKKIDIINNAYNNIARDIDDAIALKQLRNAFDAKIIEVEAEYKPKIKEYSIKLEELGMGVGGYAGDKIGATVAPVTKAASSFWSEFKKRAFVQ